MSDASIGRATAPGDDDVQGAAMPAEELAVGLDDTTVEKAKAHALERFEAEDGQRAAVS